ncbi:hypothetical protein Nit79A3_2396 [Nitrosomonas sp. Is79A3]|uniref:hypothetical protein n=1 Tax=Nitrosomonas sp. (strain Is79A3) TaxID=261292 RepID=UPI000215CA1D
MITGRPINIRGAMVTASTVPYPDTGETAWADATVYAVGDTRSYLIGDLYHKFECKLAHTSDTATGKIPEAYPDDENNAYWIDLGAVNKYAPFQSDRNTQNSADSPYIVSVDPAARVGAIAIGNIIADSVTLDVLNGATIVHTETKNLLARDVYDWYTWTYAPFRQIAKTLFSGLPLNANYTFRLTFVKAVGKVRVGQIIAAVAFDIGKAQFKGKVTRENFSTFTRTFDGEAKIKKRRNVPANQLQLIQAKAQVNGIKNIIDDLNGEVTFWAGVVLTTDGYFESLFTIGLYKQYSYSVENAIESIADIEIQEL